jgi:type IV secretion system protein VirB11
VSGVAAIPAPSGVYLRSYLAPLAAPLLRPEVTDIYVNRPGEVWLETLGGHIERYLDPALDELTLERLARQIAALTHQGISREHPLLSGTLPDGSRIQIVAPPSTRGSLVLAIRKQVAPRLALSDYAESGAFASTSLEELQLSADTERAANDDAHGADYAEILASAVRARKTILISGGTSTGKTTFLNALIREVPADERLILIEDTPELCLEHENAVGLLAVRGELGESRVTANELVAASMRMRPDRIILGELRGSEAFAFLRATNSGHPGSMTTIHADSPEGAIEQLVLLVLQAGTTLSRTDIRHHISNTIDIFVQLGRTGGRRRVERIAFGTRSG